MEPRESSLGSRIANLLRKDTMSDVVLFVGDPPKRFPCHKLLLGAGSQVFQAMFYGEMAERAEVILPDVTPTGFSIMLEYLYLDKVSLADETDAFEAAYIAKKYMIEGLFKRCEDYLLQKIKITPKVVCKMYEAAMFLEMERFKETCLRYIGKNAIQVFHSDAFGEVSPTTLKDILKLDVLDIPSESEIVEAVCQWGKEQCRTHGMEITRNNLRSFVDDVLPYIRFLTVTVEEFSRLMEGCNLLDSSEELAILFNISMPKSPTLKMPSHFSSLCKDRSLMNCTRIKISLEYRYYGDYASFSLPLQQHFAKMKVNKGNLTILGVSLLFKPIAGYSSSHRTLDVGVSMENLSSHTHSRAEAVLRSTDNLEEQCQEVIFEHPLVVADGEVGMLTATFQGEGVELLQRVRDDMSAKLGKMQIDITMTNEMGKKAFVIKDILCASTET